MPLACENATMMHARRFGKKAAQEQAAKIAKMHGGSTSFRSSMPKPSTTDSPNQLSAKKGASGASALNQHLAD
jgi:hypothetical protein